MDGYYKITEELLINLENVTHIRPSNDKLGTIFHFAGGGDLFVSNVPYATVMKDMGFDND